MREVGAQNNINGGLSRIEPPLDIVLDLLAHPEQHEREDFLAAACRLLNLPATAALLWIYDPHKQALQITHWDQPGRKPVPEVAAHFDLASDSSIPEQIAKVLGPSARPELLAWADECEVGRYRACHLLGYPETTGEKTPYPLGAVQFFSKSPIGDAPPLIKYLLDGMAAGIVRRREARVRQAITEVMQALDRVPDSKQFLHKTAQILSHALFAELILIFRYGSDLGLELVATSLAGSVSPFPASPKSILYRVARQETIRIRNIRDEAERFALLKTKEFDPIALNATHSILRQAIAAKPRSSPQLGGDTPRAWMAAPVVVTSDAENDTLAVVLAVNKNRGPAMEFTENDQIMLEKVCKALASLLPRIEMHGVIGDFASTDFRDLIEHGIDKGNQFFAVLRRLIPGAICAAIYRSDRRLKKMKLVSFSSENWFAPEASIEAPDDCILPFPDYPDRWVLSADLLPDGSKFLLGLRRSVLAPHERQIIRFVVSALRPALADFIKQSRFVDRLVQVRHAIKSGLTGAIGNSQVAIESAESLRSAQAARFEIERNRLRTAIQRVHSFIQQAATLSDQTRYLLGQINSRSLRLGDYSVSSVLREVRLGLLAVAERREIEINLEVAQGTGHYVASFDRDLVSIMVFNLVDNGIKYSRRKRRVDILFTGFEHEWTVDVADEGVYIPKEFREEIFLPYIRSYTGKHAASRPGTGLGLTVTKEIAQAHGGRVNCESEIIDPSTQLAATTFTVTLPRNPE